MRYYSPVEPIRQTCKEHKIRQYSDQTTDKTPRLLIIRRNDSTTHIVSAYHARFCRFNLIFMQNATKSSEIQIKIIIRLDFCNHIYQTHMALITFA